MQVGQCCRLGEIVMRAAKVRGVEKCAWRVAPLILIFAANLLIARGAAAQAKSFGYMRIVTQSGQMPGESTDPHYFGWIPLRQANMPTAMEISAMAGNSDAASSGANSADARAVNRPVVIYKDRDRSSLGLLGAKTSGQRFREIDIVLMKNGEIPIARYKLTDATVISVRDAGTAGGMDADQEQVRFTYSKIEVLP
jgi:type VI protein secretion system component Hcp